MAIGIFLIHVTFNNMYNVGGTIYEVIEVCIPTMYIGT